MVQLKHPWSAIMLSVLLPGLSSMDLCGFSLEKSLLCEPETHHTVVRRLHRRKG